MKTVTLLISFLVASSACAADWTSYFTSDVVDAYYDKSTKLSNTATVKWVYKKDHSKNIFITYRFKAYCTTQQLFSMEDDDTESEVKLYPDTLYEATWLMICGFQR